MASWPETLPRPALAGYTLTPLDPVLRTNMEVGAVWFPPATVASLLLHRLQRINIDSRTDQATIAAMMIRAKDQAKSEIYASMRRGGAFS